MVIRRCVPVINGANKAKSQPEASHSKKFHLENLEVKIGLIFWIFSMNCCGESRTCRQDILKGKCTEK